MNLFGNRWKDKHNPKGVSVPSFNVKDYVKVYKNVLDSDHVQEYNEHFKNLNWEKHHFHDNITNETVTYDDDLDVFHPEMINNKELGACHVRLMKKVWHVIRRYHDELGAFWYNNWKGYTPIRYNRYCPGQKMKVHCDHIHTIFDGNVKGIPILSIVGVINDDYEGGEFIMWEKQEIKLPANSVLVFPSTFVYPHKVMPVKSGFRYSYVSWVY